MSSYDFTANSPTSRQSRGFIASQACETCRLRKQKCNENRPKCAFCQRRKLECNYKEAQPTKYNMLIANLLNQAFCMMPKQRPHSVWISCTKISSRKDKTLVEILNQLETLERKVDQISIRGGQSSINPAYTGPSLVSPLEHNTHNETLPTNLTTSASSAHRILTWPVFQQVMPQNLPANIGDLNSYGKDGTTFLIWLNQEYVPLPIDDELHATSCLETVDVRITASLRLSTEFDITRLSMIMSLRNILNQVLAFRGDTRRWWDTRSRRCIASSHFVLR